MTELRIQKSIFVKTTAEAMWAYLTEPDKLEIWFHRPDQPLKQGVNYQMKSAKTGEVFMSGRVLEARPPHFLKYEFHVTPMGEHISIVEWHIEDVDGGVQLLLDHYNLPEGVDYVGLHTALDHGWDKHMGTLREGLSAG